MSAVAQEMLVEGLQEVTIINIWKPYRIDTLLLFFLTINMIEMLSFRPSTPQHLDGALKS
jgi:hypothetical protein